MNNFVYLLQGFGNALTPANLFAAFSGAVMGLVVGAIPGMGSLAGVSLLLPLTFKMPPTTAIIMLAAIYYANMYGGSFSAILLNIPGDASAVMTTLDGNKLAKKRKSRTGIVYGDYFFLHRGDDRNHIADIPGPLAG